VAPREETSRTAEETAVPVPRPKPANLLAFGGLARAKRDAGQPRGFTQPAKATKKLGRGKEEPKARAATPGASTSSPRIRDSVK
jgi:hypothetical protein